MKLWAFLRRDIVKIVGGFALFVAALLFDYFELFVPALVFYILTLLFSGFEVFYEAILGIFRRDIFDEKFLMSIGAIGALIIGKGSEGCAVMLFFIVGEYFEHLAVSRSRKSIKELMDICPDEACVLKDGVEITIDAEDVEVGDIIVIRAGERVAVDAEIISGTADVDTAHLTGEALPRSLTKSDVLESGSVVLDGMLTARCVRVASESAASRILELVETASENKAREEYFITKFARYYTPSVVVLALIIAVVPSIFGWLTLGDAVYRALVFLVFSCPCALVISVPMSFFGGIGCAASRGILYKGGNVMSPLVRAKTYAFDKTGTLTTGKLSIADIKVYGISDTELLSLAASAEHGSGHPIAECIRAAAGDYIPPDSVREIAGKGIVAKIADKTVLVGNAALMRDNGIEPEISVEAKSHVFVATAEQLLGVIVLSDTIRPEANEALANLRRSGVEKIVMLTGDVGAAANSVANQLAVDEVYSGLLPEDKYATVKEIIANGGGCVFVGDGINDAPSLALADVGIAMGAGGSDSAIESADVVIMSDNLARIPDAIAIAKNTLKIAKENIIFALGVKAIVLVLGALGFVNMWLAVFADVGVAMIAILNAMRALVYGKRTESKE